MCTVHVETPPRQEQMRLRTPLPFGLFFLRSILKHTASSSNQIIDCSLEAPGESGRALQVGRACERASTGQQHNATYRALASDGSLNKNRYAISQSMAYAVSSCFFCTAITMLATQDLPLNASRA